MEIRDEMDKAALICKQAKRESVKGDYRLYEAYKRKLNKLNLTPVQYDAAIQTLCKNLGV